MRCPIFGRSGTIFGSEVLPAQRVWLATHATGTFWFVIPSLPMFLAIPALLKRGVGFWPALAAGCALTMALYLAMIWIGPKLGLRL